MARYRIERYSADGHSDEPWSRTCDTIEEARAIVANKIESSLEEAQWSDPDSLEAYHESEEHGCGGYTIVAEED